MDPRTRVSLPQIKQCAERIPQRLIHLAEACFDQLSLGEAIGSSWKAAFLRKEGEILVPEQTKTQHQIMMTSKALLDFPQGS